MPHLVIHATTEGLLRSPQRLATADKAAENITVHVFLVLICIHFIADLLHSGVARFNDRGVLHFLYCCVLATLSSGQSSAEALFVCCGQCLVPGLIVALLPKCAPICL